MVTPLRERRQAPCRWEPSAWMREQTAKALAAAAPFATRQTTVILPLNGIGAGPREDRTCDRCRVYVPPTRRHESAAFLVGILEHRHVLTGARVSLIFGLCMRCYAAEGSPKSGSVVA